MVLVLVYVSGGEIEDPVVTLAPPKIDLPTKKPAQEPIPLERVHILNPSPEQRGALPTRRKKDDGATSYSDLRREFKAN
jgi:hypothetical protein